MNNVLDKWMCEIYKESSGLRRFPPLSSFELMQVIFGNATPEHLKESENSSPGSLSTKTKKGGAEDDRFRKG